MKDRNCKKQFMDKNVFANETVRSILEENKEKIELIRKYNYNTAEHSINVCALSVACGYEMKLSEKDIKTLGTGALLHDIGKTMIPKQILLKPGKLTEEEMNIMKRHPEYGKLMLNETDAVTDIVLYHHENEDGSGYPAKISKIPLLAKIVHIADVYDALIRDRPYKKAYKPSEAIEYLYRKSGTLFCADIVKEFVRSLPNQKV